MNNGQEPINQLPKKSVAAGAISGGIGKKIGATFGLSLLPGMGPFLGSYTRLTWGIVTKSKDGATSPIGMFLVMTGFFSDIINIIPILGPIITVVPMTMLLFIFKDQLEQSTEKQENSRIMPESSTVSQKRFTNTGGAVPDDGKKEGMNANKELSEYKKLEQEMNEKYGNKGPAEYTGKTGPERKGWDLSKRNRGGNTGGSTSKGGTGSGGVGKALTPKK
jgi:hypothetical protein